MPCPLCQTLVVAVESVEKREKPDSQEKELVLIPAPIILDATVVDPPPAEQSNHLSVLLTCPSCNNDLRLEESRLAMPFRCPLCFRLLMAQETTFSSKSSAGPKRYVLKKAPPQQTTLTEKGIRKETRDESKLPHSRRQNPSLDPGIWPAAPVAHKGITAVATELALYGVIYLSLVVLLVGVYRQDRVVSTGALVTTIAGCAVLLWKKLISLREERNVKAQFRSLSRSNNKTTSWLRLVALAGLFVLVLGNGLVEIGRAHV
jgi:hypothetical protein